MVLKLYIVGPVASGKTTLARQVSRKTGVPCFHLDQVAHEPDPDRPGGNRKRPEYQRDALFRSILAQKDYIIEDTGRRCFEAGMEQAEQILLLEPSPLLRRKRVLIRWLRQNLGLEPCAYRPTFTMLKSMVRWSRDYEHGREGTKARASRFPEKLTVLRSKKEIRCFLKSLDH